MTNRRDHANKPATNPFTWTSPQAKAIAQRSCYDCHSNQTKWWWAVKLAPFSWLAQHDIDGAQASLGDNALQFRGSSAEEQTLIDYFTR